MESNDRRDSRNRRNNNSHNNGNNGNDQRNRFRRRRRRDFFRRNRQEQRGDYPRCPICEREISNLPSAITYRESGTPAHFDCIMKKIQEEENVSSNERICYLGKGSFGIVRFQKMGVRLPFVIRKRIQYEELDQTPEWRKQLDRFYNAGREKQSG